MILRSRNIDLIDSTAYQRNVISPSEKSQELSTSSKDHIQGWQRSRNTYLSYSPSSFRSYSNICLFTRTLSATQKIYLRSIGFCNSIYRTDQNHLLASRKTL